MTVLLDWWQKDDVQRGMRKQTKYARTLDTHPTPPFTPRSAPGCPSLGDVNPRGQG